MMITVPTLVPTHSVGLVDISARGSIIRLHASLLVQTILVQISVSEHQKLNGLVTHIVQTGHARTSRSSEIVNFFCWTAIAKNGQEEHN